MTRPAQKRAAVAAALIVTVALTLTGCGSRLSYSKVLAENAALGASSRGSSTAGVGGTSGTGGSTTKAGSTAAGATQGGSTTGATTATGTGGAGTGSSSSGGGASSPSSGTCTGPATGSTVNVGQIGTWSGLIGSIIGIMRTGAQVWANYVNQHGGLNCHKVNLISADDGGDPSTALSLAQTMVQQDHVIAFLASANPLTIGTTAPYMQQVKVPAIGGDGLEPQWNTNPDLFPEGANGRVAQDGVIQAAIKQGHTQVGVVACVEFSLICSNAANIVQKDTPTLGGKVVYNAAVSIAQPDFTSQCIGAHNAGVTVLLLGLDPASIDRFVNDCANQSYHPLYVTNSVVLVSSLLTPNANGLTAAGAVFPYQQQSPETAAFDQAFQQATGAAPTGELDALAWVSGLILQAASINLPASNPTGADVLTGLYNIKNDNFGGLTSAITYQQGQTQASPLCYFTIDVANNAYVAPNGLQTQCVSSAFAPPTP